MIKLILAALGLIFATHAFAVAPLIGDVPDQNIAQGTGTGTLYFVIGDTETTFTALTVTAVASDPTLLPTIALVGTNAQRTINITSASGLTGMATVTLTVTDGEALTASSSFNVTVTTANTKPTLTALQGYQIVSPGQTPSAVSFMIGDAETAAGLLVVTASSSNLSLVPNANITLGGNGAARTLQITPVSGQKGCAVIKLRVTDALGASALGEFIFSVFDAAGANNSFRQPRSIYVLDSTAGTSIGGVPMRDGNVRDKPFVDGYVLRTEWATLEPTEGVYDFTIIDNIFTKLPTNQKLSLMLASGVLPAWLNTVPGVVTYTAGTPSVTRPLPWDASAQERYRQLLVALSNHLVDGVPLRDHPRLAALDMWIPGLKSGIRDPDEIKIRNLPGYTRTLFGGGVLTHLANVTDNFPNVPVMIGFWTYTDATPSPAPWEVLRQAILTQHNGVARPRVGFWMENLAASRSAADADPWTGLPTHTFTAPLFNSQNSTPVCYQVLGSWSRPFSAPHVDNNLNGSPEDGMDYGFNDFQCRYYEHYQADIDFANYAAEFQRWHDFLAALPGPPLALTFGSSQGGTSLSAAHGSSMSITLIASGGTAPYAWSISGGNLPSGFTLSSSGVLSGSSTQTGSHSLIVHVTDATGGSATQSYTLVIEALPNESMWTASSTRNSDGTITLGWATTPGAWYQIEVSDDLAHWTKLGSSTLATSSAMSWTDDGTHTGTSPTTQNRRFYRVRNWGTFTVSFTSTTFTYTDAQRSVTGMFQRPAGSTKLPALIINHGTGGTATGFSRTRATDMSPWGLVCIGANLTHQAGQTEDLATWGHSPENTARVRACVAALSTRSDVDLNRLAMWGHSRGAFTTIGTASELGVELKAAGFTEGGILENLGLLDTTGQPEGSYPTLNESAGITAPTLVFHVVGTPGDTVVPPITSLRLNNLLNTLSIINTRITYDTTSLGISGSASHNIYSLSFYTQPTTGVLAQWQAWLITHGVLE
ncbi:MAG: beta-galactosidase [Verrucomicrobiaceae bacterium]|nr:beta-galactosidase [Verrucomicrobiaceae bacterium]